ncbi:MAG: hypothetical protein OXI25_02405 [Chloroflexota bacterium]|nr:hypothetical protein [Chloroflexota bacterium]
MMNEGSTKERSSGVQAAIAVGVSIVVLGLLALTLYFVDRFDNTLGHGPLPSGLSATWAYLGTLLTGGLALLSAAVTLIGVRQAKYVTREYAWLVYVIVGLPLAVLLFIPLQRYGSEAFLGLPDVLVGVPARVMAGATLGALFLGGVDVRKMFSRRSQAAAAEEAPTGRGRFTPLAWTVLNSMQEQAKRFDHSFYGTEHLLLAMSTEHRSLAVRAMLGMGVNLESLRTQVEGLIGRRGALYTGASGMTRRAQRVVEQASEKARAEGVRIGTGHLLQAISEAREDVSGQLVRQMGVTPERLAGELHRLGPEEQV